MRIPFLSARPKTKSLAKKSSPVAKKSAARADKVTLSGKLGKIAKGALIGAGIGAAATALGFVGAMAGGIGAAVGVGGAVALGIGLAHKMDMVVPSSYSAPHRAGREKTFYGGVAGFMGGAFGATMMGVGALTGAGAVVAAGIGLGYASALAATRNTIMGVGEQFPNSL